MCSKCPPCLEAESDGHLGYERRPAGFPTVIPPSCPAGHTYVGGRYQLGWDGVSHILRCLACWDAGSALAELRMCHCRAGLFTYHGRGGRLEPELHVRSRT
jgi:hypothetical protein